MTSTRTRNLARAIQRANPDMKYTEALRQAEARRIGPAPDESPRVLVDESHDLRPTTESRERFKEFLRKSRFPSPVVGLVGLGVNLNDEPVYLDLLDPGSKNLAVCGDARAAHTRTLRALAHSAAEEGWGVTILGGNGNEYGDLRERHPRKVHALSGERFLSEDEIQSFHASMNPGTEEAPRLLIIDNGASFFERATEEGVRALEVLMKHPYTAVALQASLLNRVPTRINQHLNARLLLGNATHYDRWHTFGEVVPREVLYAYDFDEPAWVSRDQAKGPFWDGHRLQSVQVGDGMRPQSVRTGNSRERENLLGEAIESGALLQGHTFLGIGARYVDVDPSILNGGVTGEAGDRVWAGHCATESQARQAWEFLGSPGDEESFIGLLMRLESNQFLVHDRAYHWVEAIQIDEPVTRRERLGE